MLRLLFDENFNQNILRGLRQRLPEFEVVTVQDLGLRAVQDPELLDWVTENKRVLVTHDVNTIPKFAFDKIGSGESVAGVFVVAADSSIGEIIDQLVLHIECSETEEWQNQVHYLPI